jgi:hypothetical protein
MAVAVWCGSDVRHAIPHEESSHGERFVERRGPVIDAR